MKNTAIALMVSISLLMLCLLLHGCTKEQARSIATWENDIRQEFKVQDADNRLYNYQWFYDQYQQCNATAQNVKLLNGDEKTGTLMVLNSMIAEYNSKSSQIINAALFKADDLPYKLELSDFGL